MSIQQLQYHFTAAGQTSPWLLHDPFETPFNVSLAVYYDTTLAATLNVQFAIDDFRMWNRQAQVSQATTVITVTDSGYAGNGHGLAVGDYVHLQGSGASATGGLQNIDGDYNVATVTSATVYTLTAAVSQTLPSFMGNVFSGRVFTHSTLQGVTSRANGNYGAPVQASRLICPTTFTTAGYASLVAMQGAVSS